MNIIIFIFIIYSVTEATSLSSFLELQCCRYCFLGTRFDDGADRDNEVQRTMLELINQLDGFDPRGNIKVLMATNQ